jgi:tetratricopeptide (TPR) repeat protein
VDYWIQRARVLDKEALLELKQKSPKAYDRSREAIKSLDAAIQRVPENGGLHEQRAILLMNLVDIMRKQGKGLQEIRAAESEEAKEYTRALELRPKEESALWGAVYAQIDLGNYEDAVDLARTITLLRPESNAASTAYIVALERAIRTPGQEPKRESEVRDGLKQLLRSNPNESQLLALWTAFAINNDREGLGLVTAEANRRFPKNLTFEQRRLQSYLVDSVHYDGQNGE